MAVTGGGFRSNQTYKVSIDTDLDNAIIHDITGQAGSLYLIQATGASGWTYISFYDTFGAVIGTTVPLFAIPVPPTNVTTLFIPEGIAFANCISFAATSTNADVAQTGAVSGTLQLTITTS